ncbi:MAG: sugar phosphate isomerase/epimerase [Bacteroidetes bacterium]|nr:sugar phosphate isomerase/epimerase [Bacteroidota bacterium]
MKRSVQSLLFFSAVIFFAACNNQSEKKADEAKADTAAAAPAKPDVTKEWKIGVQMWTFNHFTFVEGLSKVDSAGVKFIEAFPGQKLGEGFGKESFGIDLKPESRQKLKQLLQSKGITMMAFGVIDPKTVAEWKKFFDLGKDMGVSYITAEPRKDQWNQVDSLAGVYGIKIAIHDHPKPNAYSAPDSVLAAVAGHPNIGSCADVGHWARNGYNPVDCLKKLSGHVYGVHLKDIKKFDDPKAEDTVVGKGVNNFPAIFQELKDQGFTGMLSIEQESNWYHSLPDVINTVKYFHDEVGKLK